MNKIRRPSIAALDSRPGVTLVGGTVAVAAVDLVTKAAAPVMVPVAPWLLAPMSNDELSLGVVGSSAPVLVAAMAAGLLAAALVAVQLIRRGRVGVVGCLLVLGGALGNLVDRAATGAVNDFLIAGPVVLNVADLAVVAGAVSIARALHRTGGVAAGAPAASTQPAPPHGRR